MLTQLRIHNYRCFVEFELNLPKSALLLGMNGSGKSSVFEVLSSIRELIARDGTIDEVFPTDTLALLGTGQGQKFELEMISPYGTILYRLDVMHNRERRTCHIDSESVQVFAKDGGSHDLFTFRQGQAVLYDQAEQASRSVPFVATRSFLSSVDAEQTRPELSWFLEYIDNIWVLKIEPGSVQATAPRAETFLNENGANFAAFCQHLILEEREIIDHAVETIRGVIPGLQQLTLKAMGKVRVLTARFRAPGDKPAYYELDFDALSDGQRQLIILYVVLSFVRTRASLLCFDEPDNFVSIREIQPFLIELSDGVDDGALQCMMISHSAEIIDYFGAENSILLERPEGGATSIGQLTPVGSLRLSELMARGWHDAR